MSATPDLQALGKTPFFLEWQSYPSMEVDARLCRPVSKRCCSPRGVERGAPLVFLCRSGARSRQRRNRNDERGLGALFQHIGWVRRSAGRFAPERRRRRVEGGRVALDADLKRQARPFLGIAAFLAVHLHARATSMDMYDEPDPDRVDQVAPGAPPLAEAWRRCCARLRAEVGDDVFNSWFGRLALESVGSGQARLSVPTRFLKSWIDTHYVGHLSAALNAEVGPVAQILISVRCSAPLEPVEIRRPNAPRPPRRAPKPPRAGRRFARQPIAARPAERLRRPSFGDALTGSPLDRRLTFATFQVGRSNQLAFHAAQRVADHAGAGRPPFARSTSIRRSASARPISCRRSRIPPPTRALGHLSDRRAIHVRFRRRAAGADVDRVQGAAESDRPADFRRRPVPAGKVDPGRIRSCAQRPARRRARGDRRRRPPSE